MNGCATVGQDPYSGNPSGDCCPGLYKIQGQFQSSSCSYQCFACTGHGEQKDPFANCGETCWFLRQSGVLRAMLRRLGHGVRPWSEHLQMSCSLVKRHLSAHALYRVIHHNFS